MSALKYLAGRLVGVSAVMLLVVTITFVIARIIPGDPAGVILGPSATPEDIEALRVRLGLNEPIITQFALYLRAMARLDLGDSIFLNRPVLQAIGERAGLTLQLTLLAAAIAVLIGLPIGILSAVRRGSALDQAFTAISISLASLPSFLVGLLLIRYLAVELGWFPVAGYGSPGAGLAERLYHLVLPAIAVAVPNSALILRFTRTSMLEVLHEDFIRTARAKGLSPALVILKHGLWNAFIPILTVIGLMVASLIGGAIVTETVFGLPGIGNLIVTAVVRRDYPVIQGALLVVSGAYVLLNLLIDLLYAAIDPRVRY
jgi:peptide/nickel transport system permease protein